MPPGAGVVSIKLTANGVDFQRVGTFSYYTGLEVNEAFRRHYRPRAACEYSVRGRYLESKSRTVDSEGSLWNNTRHVHGSRVHAPPHQSGLARVGLSFNGVDFVDGPRVYYESSRPRVDAVKPAVVAPGAPTTTMFTWWGGPFAPVEGWRAELLIQGMEYDFECAFSNTTHIACAVALTGRTIGSGRPPPALARFARLFG